MLSIVVDGFFGDTGKGKVVSYLSLRDDVDIVVRAGVGPNAGHTVIYKGKEYKLRQIPSGFVNRRSKLMIGAGVLVYPPRFFEELEITNSKDRTYVDFQTGIIEDRHIEEEMSSEHLSKKIGSTRTGCGAAMKDRVLRKLKLARDFPELKPFLKDVSLEVNQSLDRGERVIIEGTQGTFLSLYHGTYPYVTSKDVTASAFCSDVGVGPKRVDEVILVFKSYVTRVGGGPLENEYTVEEAKERNLLEIATVTGRIRRAAPFNFNYARRAVMLNSPTQIALTKLDILFKEDFGKKKYEDLSKNAKEFIEKIEEELKIPVTLISTGPDSEQMIDRRQELGLL